MGRWLFIYPFVGSTDWTHALNLADADGNFERFKISWSGVVAHNDFGVTCGSGGSGNTGCDCADAYKAPPGGCSDAWNRKSHGAYFRTNSAVGSRDMSASFVEPKNGYTYVQGLIPRYVDGVYYGDLCRYFKSGVPETGNRASVAVGDSLGLFTDNQRGPTMNPSHYVYKRGVVITYENTAEVGMGYGDGLGLAMMIFSGTRNWAFAFSTKHPKALEAPMKTDGSGGMMPGINVEFNYFVEQLQVALLRNV